MRRTKSRVAFATMLGSAVLSQAILSAASFVVGILLIRYLDDLHYGYFVLASNAVLLLISLHGAFVNPPMVARLTEADAIGRGQLIGGLYREQMRVLTANTALACVVCAVLWSTGVLDHNFGPLLLMTLVAGYAALVRNFFRMVLLALRRAQAVLFTDIAYVLALILGAWLAIDTQLPAVATMAAMSVAAILSSLLAAHAAWRAQPWDLRGAPGILRSIAPSAALSTAGAGIHWAFAQGYIYIAAGLLDVAAVAAIAATRMLMMPLNLLSTGIGTLLLPLTAGWLQRSAEFAWRRLCQFALALAGIALAYFAFVWLARDWLFAEVLNKQFEHRDQLLLLWALAFLPMVVRDQLIYLLVARERFKQLTPLVFACALVSLCAGYIGMREFGVLGAPLGVFVGELMSLCGITLLSLRHIAPPSMSARNLEAASRGLPL